MRGRCGEGRGQGDYETAKEYSKTIQIMFLGVGLFMAGLVFLFRAPLFPSTDQPLTPRSLT